ncbi:efflux RND transporter permease subunit [Aphanothece sacrum]|uniref:Acriflavin resistance protein n=1 Tax=Aphanothece sacrum FPU1 TaxID=1920663 RepID=A0A401IMD5_APHSA|nr:efflux RND transporter permease subunit [Aphanothece sacrum]GBF82403.1 acriflavin resistance protein [Aphanothece sacrum FPU1]GBF84304.1 acriflavin resistance protein [Aphanothece sacrum FPU3]
MKQSLRENLNISRLAIKYARITLFFWIAVAVAGMFAFSSLKYALFPEVPFPVVIVNASATLDTTQVTESKLTNPIETSLRSLSGAEVFSSTYPGQAVINVAFSGGSNLDDSTKAVETALKNVSLPPNATLEVIPFNLNESIVVTYAISSENQSLESVAQIVRNKIVPSLEKISGLLRVDLLGDGNFRETKIENTPTTNPPTLIQFNKTDSLALQIVKRADANTLDVMSQVEQVMGQVKKSLPELQFNLGDTPAGYIEEATNATIEALIGAIVLAVLIIFFFLKNFESTLITALAIPISLLGTFIVMAIAGFNLETITLLGLALVIGIIVDDAIVDVENISRHIDLGESPRQAAIEGTDEIGLTVTVSTLTLAAVFLPIAFIGGNLGQFFKPFGITVAASVLISLLVARTLSPVLAIYWMKPNPIKATKKSLTDSFLVPIYRKLLIWSLSHRKLVIGIAMVSFVAGVSLIPLIPKGFIPKLDRGEFNIIYTLPTPKIPARFLKNIEANKTDDSGSSLLGEIAKSPESFLLRKTYRVGKKLEGIALDNANVESAYIIAGFQGNPLKGKIHVQLKSDRQLNTSEMQEKIREKLPPLKGGTISIEDILFVETGDDAPLKVALLGENLQTLNQTAETLKKQLKDIPGLVDIKISGDKNNLIIEHFQQQRVVYITANLLEEVGLGDVTNKVVKTAKTIVPSGVKLDVQGASAQVRSIFQEFGFALILAIICMLTVLYIPFGRWLEPLVVVLSLPLSIVGAMFGLLITQSEFGMISLIGLIFLLGLLNKNAVLLMDYINQLRQRGISRYEAILTTGETRLRPIVMTTASTILGMLPIALGLGAGAELRQPMAVAIIGGLITSSLLSLIVVPVLYTLLEDSWGKLSVNKFKQIQK